MDSTNMINFKKICICKKVDKWRESFSPNTNSFFAFFVSEWGRILERAMHK